MPNIYSSKRPTALQRPRAANRHVGPAIRRARDYGYPVVLAILFWLIFYMYLPFSLDGFAGKGTGITEANDVNRDIKLAMILISAYFISSRLSLALSLAKKSNPGAMAFVVLAPLSAVWSIDPSASILRFVSLIAIVMVCYAASVTGWHRLRLQQLAIPPLMFILVVSLVIGIAMPDRITELGTDVSQLRAWHGITHGKNEFGMVASFAGILCANRWLAGEGRTIWAVAGTIVASLCVILSRSNTSLLAMVVGVMTMVLVMRVPVIKRQFTTLVVVAIPTALALYELAIQNVIPGVNTLLAPILSLTGKDVTFSARTIIWDTVKEHIHYSPLLGTGYGAYWVGPVPTSPSYVFVPLMFFYPTEAHNGYLDVINDLGYLGLLCLIVYLVWYIRQALQLMPFDRTQAALYLALLFQEIVLNMSESEWLSRTNTFAVLILATTCLSRGLLQARANPGPTGPGR